ncbi:MAG: hypothetical protein J7L32_00605 [Thermoplasmata archaeon]|nr:hypothetical protein [Thermoplasmata archaeon]
MAVSAKELMEINDLKEINDIKYSIIVPKYDNSGRKIRVDKIAEKVKKMARHFGGVTVIPSVLGCWEDDSGKLVCEENAEIYSIRDIDKNEKPSQISKIRNEDTNFIVKLGEEIGKDLGQAVVMVSNARTEMSFVSGEYKDSIKDTGVDWFKKLI